MTSDMQRPGGQAGRRSRDPQRLRAFSAMTVGGLGLCAVLGGPARAQSDGLLCRGRALLGAYDAGRRSTGVALGGDVAYLALGTGGLRIIDISDRLHPDALAAIALPGELRHLELSDTSLYVAGSSGLSILDVGDPSSPSIVGGFGTAGVARDVRIAGDTALLATDHGLVILDVADPAWPDLLATADVGAPVVALDVAGTLAFVSAWELGLRIFDVSDPGAPALVGTFELSRGIEHIEVAGTVAYLCTRLGDLHVLDVADPAAPELLAQWAAPVGWAQQVTVRGSLAYVTDSAVHVLDVADPIRPTLLTSYYPPEGAATLAIEGELATVSDGPYSGAGMRLLDLSTLHAPALLGEYRPDDSMSFFRGDLRGSTAFLAAGEDGLIMVDVSDPLAPRELGVFSSVGDVRQVRVSEGLAFLASDQRGLEIIDISDPASPHLLGVLETEYDEIEQVAIDGQFVYIADDSWGFRVVDATEPDAPSVVGEYGGLRDPEDMVAMGGLVYVADGAGGLLILDVTNPASPSLAGDLDLRSPARRVAVAGGRAYLGADTGELFVVDVSQPVEPQLIATMSAPAGVAALAAHGGLVYAASGRSVLAFDLTDPHSAQVRGSEFVGGSPSGGRVADLMIDGSAVYALQELDGLRLVDASDCPCVADFNGDSEVDSRDVIGFLNAWVVERGEDCASGDCETDLDENGVVDTRDFVAFLNAWAAGC